MRQAGSKVLVLCVAATMAAMPLTAAAQIANEPGPHTHILLPPAFGATPLSTQIHAQAAYIASLGDYLESEAIARRHHALAAEQEMRNAVQWVTTYFERRALNRAYRLKEKPAYLDREEHRHEQAKRRIVDDPYLSAQGDLTEELNWLLEELSAMWMAYRYLPADQALVDSKIDLPLKPEDISHIRLTEGTQVGGRAMVFRANDAKPLEAPWPLALRGPEFEAERKHFEEVRDQTLQEVAGGGKLSFEGQTRLMKAVDTLCEKFNAEYSEERRVESPAAHATYTAGKRFLRSLAGSVYRLIEANDARLFDGAHRFEGDSAVDLIEHMYSCGLQFAPPEVGDEGMYRKLFFCLRQIYTTLASQQPAPQPPDS
jgi:hypothetical protein